MSVSGGTTTESMISGLLSSTNYSIEVAAVNSAGTGVYSSPVIALTNSESHKDIYTHLYAHTRTHKHTHTQTLHIIY